MEDRDAEEFVLVLQGYYRLLAGRELFVDLDKDMWNQESGTSNNLDCLGIFCPVWNFLIQCYLISKEILINCVVQMTKDKSQDFLFFNFRSVSKSGRL